MSAFLGVSSYQSSSLGSKFVVIGVVCCQEMRRYALFHKVLRGLAKYLAETVSADKEISTFSLSQIDPELTLPEAIEQYPQILDIFYVRILSDEEIEQCKADGVGTIEDEDISAVALLSSLNARKVPVDAAPGSVYGSSQNGPWPYEQVN